MLNSKSSIGSVIRALTALAIAATLGGISQAGQPNSLVAVVGQMELPRLLDLASEQLNARIDYDAKAVMGTVTVRDKAGLSKAELWAFVNEQLAARDFTTVRAAESGGFSVVKIAVASGMARPMMVTGLADLRDQLGPEPRPGYVTVQIAINHRRASSIAKALAPPASKGATGGTITQIGESDLIAISDLRPRVEELLTLLAALDEPTDATVDEYTARFLTPQQLVSQVKELIIKRDLVAGEKAVGDVVALSGKQTVHIVAPRDSLDFWRAILIRLDQQGTLVETRTYTPRVFAIKDVARLVEQVARESGPPGSPSAGSTSTPNPTPSTSSTPGNALSSGGASAAAGDAWRMVIDELTGSLIITTTAAQHLRVADLLARLDAVPGDASQKVRAFAIRNRPVREVADALNKLLELGAGDAGGTEPGKSSLPGSSPAPSTRVGGPTIPTTPRVKLTVDEGMNALIAVGDPRFLAQAEELLKTLDVRQPQVMIEVMLVSLTDGQSRQLGIELEKFGSLDGSAVRLTSLFSTASGAAGGGGPSGTPGSGFTGSVLNAGDFNAVVRAFESINNGRSASMPQILVTNNQEASFNSTAQQPTSTVSRDATATTTTGFGGFQDAGTKISVKPQIADGDQLVLTYKIELSSFTGSPTSPGLPSPRQQNNVNSVAMIPDGHAVVVGGLEFTTDTEDESRVPFIADIPVLGELFKSRSKTQNRTRFFVFIRANVMRDSGYEDLKYVSGKALDQNGVDVDDGWPKVLPRVMK